jgi:CRISPR-associated protein Cmr3
MTSSLRITPVDILHLRGNRLFGGPGDHGEARMLPWPSLFAGALRSHLLAGHGIDPSAYATGGEVAPGRLGEVLGTPQQPGSFRITGVALCRRHDGHEQVLVPLPADCVVEPRPGTSEGLAVHRLQPIAPAAIGPGIATGCELPRLPVLQAPAPFKPVPGCWLTGDGLAAYLAGAAVQPQHLVHQHRLWLIDPRLGIALGRQSRTAAQGKIYTAETVALAEGVSFLVGVDGVPDDLLPAHGLLRLGGDGRGAEVARWPGPVLPASVPAGPGFTIVLATPGLLPQGWRLPGLAEEEGGLVLRLGSLVARLVAAAIPRYQVISGWDLAGGKPKTAQRALHQGSVYWFEHLEGDPAQLQVLAEQGLWHLLEAAGTRLDDSRWRQRRAEGFNNLWLGSWQPAACC